MEKQYNKKQYDKRGNKEKMIGKEIEFRLYTSCH